MLTSYGITDSMDFTSDSPVKESACNAGAIRDANLIPGSRDPLREEMTTHSSILA